MHTRAENIETMGRGARRAEQAMLHRALRDAAKVHKLSDAVVLTATALIGFIPDGAPAPISPVQVQRLADERGCDARTIRNHIRQLIRAGLATDCCRDGGGRVLIRASNGAIVSLHGISMALLLAQAARLAQGAAEINARATEKAHLRAEISMLRRRIKKHLENASGADEAYLAACRRQFAQGPVRLAHLDLEALARLWGSLTDMIAPLEDAHREAPKPSTGNMRFPTGRKILTDNYITTDLKNECCNQDPIKRREQKRSERSAPGIQTRPTSGLEHVSLPMALAAAPEDWAVELERFGDHGWSALVAVAYERLPALGINQSAWAMAQAVLGRNGAAILVLIADARHSARGGTIRHPGAWMRRMAERAERGEAHLHRSIFGILHEGKVVQ